MDKKKHKKPWQEKYATPGEIKAMLDARVSLRYNEVRGRTEIHYLSAGPVIKPDEQGLLTIFGGDGGVTDGYANLDDRDVNTLWTALSWLFPSTFGVRAFIRVNSMGASVSQVLPELRILWIQAAAYLGLACLVYRHQFRLMRKWARSTSAERRTVAEG